MERNTRTQVAIYASEAAQTPNAPSERFYAAFQTFNPRAPFVEVTVIAATRVEAKRLAESIVAPIGLSHAEID